MAGLNDLTQAAFSGGRPGPAQGTDVDSSSALATTNISAGPREGANLILDALGAARQNGENALTRLNRRAAQNG